MPRAVSGLNVSRTNRSKVASSSPVSGVPSRVGPGPSRINSPAALPPPVWPDPARLRGELPCHAALHGLADLGMERVVRRPIGLSLAIDPHQSALELPRANQRRQPRQRVRPARSRAPARAKSPAAPGPGDGFEAIGPGRVFVGLARRAPARRSVGQFLRQNHGRGAAISQVSRQVVGGRERSRVQPRSPPKGSRACGRSGRAPTFAARRCRDRDAACAAACRRARSASRCPDGRRRRGCG